MVYFRRGVGGVGEWPKGSLRVGVGMGCPIPTGVRFGQVMYLSPEKNDEI